MLYIGYDKEVGGIGDFVYILFQIYYFYSNIGADAANNIKICIPNHSLKKCIECFHDEPNSCEKIRIIASSMLDNIFINDIYCNLKNIESEDKHHIIYSNMNDFLHLSVRNAPPSKINVLKKDFREKVFRISPFLLEHVDNLILKSRVSNFCGGVRSETENVVNYSAIHIRCGDIFLRGGGGGGGGGDNAYKQCSPKIEKIENIFKRGVDFLQRSGSIPIFIFCDNIEVKNDLAERFNCYTFPTKVIHIADTDDFTTPSRESPQNFDFTTPSTLQNFENTNSAAIDTFAEFVLLGRSKEIFAVSVSNFSQVPAFIYDIPIYTIDTNTNEIIRRISI